MKKLWARSRSRGRGSQSKKEVNGSVIKSGSRDHLPITNGEAPPPVPVRSKDRDSQLLKENGKPGVGYKPVLVGITRPTIDISRPGTSGSLQNAVNLAADKVVQASSPDYVPPSHSRTKSPRYIDIFSISNPKSSKLGYNEDVAARNLDTKVVASNHAQSQPAAGSRYQEEVAARNVQPTEKVRASADVPRTTESEQARQTLPQRSSTVIGTYQVQNPVATADDIIQYNHAMSMTTSAPKRWSGEAPNKIPPVASETPVSSRPVTGQSAQTAYQRQAASNQARTLSLDTQTSKTRPTTSEIHQQLKQPRSPPSSYPSHSMSRVEAVLLGTTESGPLMADMSKDSVPRTGYEHRTDHRSEHRTGSALSNTSSVKRSLNLPNRTIMDLTGEDTDVFEEYAESDIFGSDMSRTPILEEAREGYFHPASTVVSPIEAIPEEYFPDIGQKNDETPRPKSPTTPVETSSHAISSFSTVNTLVSMSPTKTSKDEPSAMRKHVPIPTFVVDKPPASKLYTVAETEPEVQDYGLRNKKLTAMDRGENKSRPRKPNTSDYYSPRSSFEIPPAVRSPNQNRSSHTPQQSSSPATIQQSPESLKTDDFIDPSRSFGVLTRDFAVTPSKTEQIVRTDNEPNMSAKVRPTKSAKILNETMNGDVMHKRSKPEPATNETPRSSFNEDDFRRKQEQARAALVRLQQSLNEDFLNGPVREAPKKQESSSNPAKATDRTQPRNHHKQQNSNDGRPVAPTSIFSKGREQQGQQTREVNGYSKPKDMKVSIHEQVTQPRPAGAESAKRSQSARNRSRSPNPPTRTYSTLAEARTRNRSRSKGKGKESEIELRLAEIERLTQQMSRPYPHVLPPKSPRRQHLVSDDRTPVPPSPGEVSLSSFPLPTPNHSRGPSEVTSPPMDMFDKKNTVRTNPPGAGHRPSTSASSDMHYPSQRDRVLNRRNSTRSQSSQYSSASQFSIPSHLIPERNSSMRDSLVREVEQES